MREHLLPCHAKKANAATLPNRKPRAPP